jgi:hypothetical protein
MPDVPRLCIDPFCAPAESLTLPPETIVYALRRSDGRLSGQCYTTQDAASLHPWRDRWAGRSESTKVVPMTLQAYLMAHAGEIEGSDGQQHERANFNRFYRERWGLDGGDADAHRDMTSGVTSGEAS